MRIHNQHDTDLDQNLVPEGYPEISVKSFCEFKSLNDKTDALIIRQALVVGIKKALDHFWRTIPEATEEEQILFRFGVYHYAFAELLLLLPVHLQINSESGEPAGIQARYEFWKKLGLDRFKGLPGFSSTALKPTIFSALL